MLGADIVGFHTFAFSRHFLSSCMRVLGLDTSIDSLIYRKHTTQVKTMVLGTDPEFWQEKLGWKSVAERITELHQSFRGKKVILGVDSLDYIKGIPLKLLAFEAFLTTNPQLAHLLVRRARARRSFEMLPPRYGEATTSHTVGCYA